VTLIAGQPVPEAVYAQAQQHFSDEELVKLMIAIAIINTWNRFAITFGDVPGSYQPDHFACVPAGIAVKE
jgi:alkylhydroperoxidase family enzyme